MRSRRGATSRVVGGSLHRIPFVGAVVMALLVSAAGQGFASPAGSGQGQPPTVAAVKAAKNVRALAVRHQPVHDAAANPYRATRGAWPTAKTVNVTPSSSPASGAAASATGTPISLRATSKAGSGAVTVTTVAHESAVKAGIHGTVFALNAKATRSVAATVDYSSFADAEGGNFGYRLHLVSLPACALTTPSVAECQKQTAIASKNDTAKSSVTGTVALSAGAAQVLALSTADLATASTSAAVAAAAAASPADGGSPGGSYQATSLSPTGSWAQGGSSGSFTYSYPIAVPPGRSGLQPDLSLGYDSASVDGKTSSSQAQSGWAGDGWSTPSSYIEWTYASCSDDPEGSAAPTKTSDSCYDGPIVTMSLKGGTTELVRDDANGKWRERTYSGAVITQVSDSASANGTYDNDYWKVVTRDGSTYYFGLNHLPGFSSGDAATNSVQTVPVFSAHKGDPCFQRSAATWAGSVCTMGYRWNLDYVTDAHSNAMAYFYSNDINYYGQNLGATMASYVRDAYLKEVRYGFVNGQVYGKVPNRVTYSVGPRCFTGTCTALTSGTAANFPDVPFDLICASGAKCTAQAPSFFSTVRLTSIATQQYNSAAATPGYQTIDSYSLNETIPSVKSGDSAAPTLWLSGISRTGSDQRATGSKTSITMPTVGFTATALQNRVDIKTVVLPPLYRNRISAITTESGGVIGIDYGLSAPCSASAKPTAATNTKSCFPVRWTPAGSSTVDDWFNRYAVTRVTESDATGGAVTKVSSYNYGGLAWHYDVNEVVKKKYRSYGQFHGYASVTTTLGDGVNDPKTKHVTRYYQGMSKNNSTTVAELTDSAGGKHEDFDELQGKVVEDTAYQGDGGAIDSSTINAFWVSDAIASRPRTGLPTLEARAVAPALVWTRQRVISGSEATWRVTANETSYDSSINSNTFGLAKATYMHTVPAEAAYDSCTVTDYAPVNAGLNLVGLANLTETDSVACSGYTAGSPSTLPGSGNNLGAPAAVNRPAQVKSATRTYYDGATALTTVPTVGQATTIEQATDFSAGAFVWAVKGKTTFDAYGRVKSATDGNNNTTTTSFTDDAYGLMTATKVTNPLNQSVTQTIDPARGLVLTNTDANQNVSTVQYDTVGRITDVWSNSRAITDTPNQDFEYHVSQTGVTSVTTKKMNSTGGFIVSTQLYDALMRKRQTQSPTPKGGRVVTDIFYDSRGWVQARNNRWWDSTTIPGATMVTASSLPAAVPSGDTYYFDGLGRVIADESTKNGVVISTSHTVYTGDRTTSFPGQAGDHTKPFPASAASGVITTTVTDPIGRTTELQQYTSTPTVAAPANTFTGTYAVTGGAVTRTKYGFDGHGLQSTITDNNGNTWSSSYDLIGQTVAKTDPVAGTSTRTYDGMGNTVESTDGAGHTISSVYDAINRVTDQWSAPVNARSDANKTSHRDYDSTTLKFGVGKLAKTTTYVGGTGGSAYVTSSTGFNTFGESLGESITIPAVEGAMAGTYTYGHLYGELTGLDIRDTYPAVAAADLPAQSVTRTYSGFLDLPDSVTGFEIDTAYDAYGRVEQATLGSANGRSYVTNTYDDHTDKLVTRSVDRYSSPTQRNIETHTYDYDVLGNITSEAQSRLGANSTPETRCYQYDLVQRLTAAWTATDNCAATPSSSSHANVGDPLDANAAYWSTWTYDAIGRRTNQTEHAITGSATQVSTDYAYTSTTQPLTLSSATSTSSTPNDVGGTLTTTTAVGYAYDATGNLKTRNGTDYGDQTLAWTDTGNLASVTSPTKGVSSYTYDAAGQLLSQHDPNSWTLYLPDSQLSVNTATQAVSGIRYYSLPGGQTGHRTGSGNAYGFDIADAHGTVELTLDDTAQNPTWRAFTPFGQSRGSAPGWHDNRTFLNKPADTTTGFVNIGARNYDPTTGTFISLDPLLSPSDPQQLSGYSYAGNNPVLYSDPTGRMWAMDGGGGGSSTVASTSSSGGGSSSSSTGGDGGYAEQTGCTGNGSTQGNETSTAQPVQPEEHKSFWGSVGSWVSEHKAAIAGTVVGIATFAVCEGATAGAGTIGCAALAGAAGKVTSDYVNNQIHGVTDFVESATVGAAEGVLAVPIAAVDAVHQSKAIYKDVKEGDYAGAVGHGALLGLDAATVVGGTKAATRGCGNSFVGGTMVLLADGSSKAIEDVTLDDKVVADDPTVEQQSAQPVTALIHGDGTKTLVDLSLDTNADGEADASITPTDNHPIFNDDTHTWVRADELTVGAHLRTANHEQAAIVDVSITEQPLTVYNLTVSTEHTYYVLAGAVALLVHNCPNGTNARGEVTSRSSFRKSTKQGSWDNAESGPNGGKLCPSCGSEVSVPPGTGTRANPSDWDNSHNPSWTNREFPDDVSRRVVRDDYNSGVNLECIACNRGGGNDDSRFK